MLSPQPHLNPLFFTTRSTRLGREGKRQKAKGKSCSFYSTFWSLTLKRTSAGHPITQCYVFGGTRDMPRLRKQRVMRDCVLRHNRRYRDARFHKTHPPCASLARTLVAASHCSLATRPPRWGLALERGFNVSLYLSIIMLDQLAYSASLPFCWSSRCFSFSRFFSSATEVSPCNVCVVSSSPLAS